MVTKAFRTVMTAVALLSLGAFACESSSRDGAGDGLEGSVDVDGNDHDGESCPSSCGRACEAMPAEVRCGVTCCYGPLDQDPWWRGGCESYETTSCLMAVWMQYFRRLTPENRPDVPDLVGSEYRTDGSQVLFYIEWWDSQAYGCFNHCFSSASMAYVLDASTGDVLYAERQAVSVGPFGSSLFSCDLLNCRTVERGDFPCCGIVVSETDTVWYYDWSWPTPPDQRYRFEGDRLEGAIARYRLSTGEVIEPSIDLPLLP
ncbi:MAG: hypothetical protein AABZ63_06620 [Actinomycetota bacterium]